MNAWDNSERPHARPDYEGWEDIREISGSEPTGSPAPTEPSDKGPPPKDEPDYRGWSDLIGLISGALGYTMEPVHEVAVTLRMMTPRQLAVVGVVIVLGYLGGNAPANADLKFAGWLTVVILVAGLGGLALYRDS